VSGSSGKISPQSVSTSSIERNPSLPGELLDVGDVGATSLPEAQMLTTGCYYEEADKG
jgi:hypothetical protein